MLLFAKWGIASIPGKSIMANHYDDMGKSYCVMSTLSRVIGKKRLIKIRCLYRQTMGNNDNSAAAEGHYAMPALSPTTRERLAAQQNIENQYNSMANNKTKIATRDEKATTETTSTTAPRP